MKGAIIAGIVFDFIQKKTLTLKQISDKYEISTRTAHRYLSEIGIYVPIYSQRGYGGGYTLLEDSL